MLWAVLLTAVVFSGLDVVLSAAVQRGPEGNRREEFHDIAVRSEQSHGLNGLTPGQIAGFLVGTLGSISLLGLLWFVVRRRHRRRRHRYYDDPSLPLRRRRPPTKPSSTSLRKKPRPHIPPRGGPPVAPESPASSLSPRPRPSSPPIAPYVSGLASETSHYSERRPQEVPPVHHRSEALHRYPAGAVANAQRERQEARERTDDYNHEHIRGPRDTELPFDQTDLPPARRPPSSPHRGDRGLGTLDFDHGRSGQDPGVPGRNQAPRRPQVVYRAYVTPQQPIIDYSTSRRLAREVRRLRRQLRRQGKARPEHPVVRHRREDGRPESSSIFASYKRPKRAKSSRHRRSSHAYADMMAFA